MSFGVKITSKDLPVVPPVLEIIPLDFGIVYMESIFFLNSSFVIIGKRLIEFKSDGTEMEEYFSI